MRTIQIRDEKRRNEQTVRQHGYDDGYLGRVARTSEAVYQQAWRRGREARERDNADA